MENRPDKITNAVLLALLEERWKASDKRLDRMEENILSEQKKTNGRVLRSEEAIKKVEEEVEVIQKWQIKLDNSKWWVVAIVTGLGVIGGIIAEVIK
jgi:hypothetical protein